MTATQTMRFARIEPGDPGPWFTQRTQQNPRFVFDTAGGRYVVLSFLVTAGDETGKALLAGVMANRPLFDDDRAAFFGVSLDPSDESEGRIADRVPGIRFFLDHDGAVSRLFGAIPADPPPDPTRVPTRRFSLLLDPTLRVIATFPLDADGNARLMALLRSLPPPSAFAGTELMAPVLFLPNVFEPEFCRGLIDLYEAKGGTESGFMREVDGKTVMVTDHGHKQRRDVAIEDQALIEACRERIRRRVAPEIRKAFQFNVSRMERYIVACYSAAEGGHFRAHRDNTTKGTAHRRFAVSINLNAEFEGGEVSFPEYGPRSFKPPPGGAVVFSCSLLHAVSRITAGTRYAFLPFLYDDAAAKIREENNRFLGDNVGAYRAGTPAAPPG